MLHNSLRRNSSFVCCGIKSIRNCTSGSKMPMVAENVVEEVVCFMHCEKCDLFLVCDLATLERSLLFLESF